MGVAANFLKKQKNKIDKKFLVPIPFFFTFANAILGLVSVFYALDKDIKIAAYCILMAGVCDMLDGKLARALGVESMLGVALDSLCDAISFCFAPAVLLYSWRLHELYAGKWVVASFLCFGLYRLAKFTVVGHENQSVFHGIPTTASALFMSTLVLYQVATHGPWYYYIPHVWISLLVLVFGLLMISSIEFDSFKKKTSNLVFSYCKVIFGAWVFLATFWYEYPLVLCAISLYIGWYSFKYLYRKLF